MNVSPNSNIRYTRYKIMCLWRASRNKNILTFLDYANICNWTGWTFKNCFDII